MKDTEKYMFFQILRFEKGNMGVATHYYNLILSFNSTVTEMNYE